MLIFPIAVTTNLSGVLKLGLQTFLYAKQPLICVLDPPFRVPLSSLASSKMMELILGGNFVCIDLKVIKYIYIILQTNGEKARGSRINQSKPRNIKGEIANTSARCIWLQRTLKAGLTVLQQGGCYNLNYLNCV